MSDDEELIIEGSDEDASAPLSPIRGEGDEIPCRPLDPIVSIFNAFFFHCQAELQGSRITVKLPRAWLPLCQQAVLGLLREEVLLCIQITYAAGEWTDRPFHIDVRHPTYGSIYPGHVLVQAAVQAFSTPGFVPRARYQSVSRMLRPSGKAVQGHLAQLLVEGYDPHHAEIALIVCQNDLGSAITFLNGGEIHDYATEPPFDLEACPLGYLVLEIAEAFLDLSSHCCLCGDKLKISTLKPAVCSRELCRFQIAKIGIGAPVSEELRRDPIAADLIFSMFSAALDGGFLTDRPDVQGSLPDIMESFPPMAALAEAATNDQALQELLGLDAFSVLRRVLMSSRAHLISLAPEHRFAHFRDSHQFLTLFSSPEAEAEFDGLRETWGSLFLWHGSSGDRWYSILRSGLRNAANHVGLMAHGAAHGSGIYLASASGTSLGYAQGAPNRYKNSVLGEQLAIPGLCEVANMDGRNLAPTPAAACGKRMRKRQRKKASKEAPAEKRQLFDWGWCHTLTKEAAIVVRYLVVVGDAARNHAQWDVRQEPPQCTSLAAVIRAHARTARHM
jgi:poly [ADP-ribose] polymerase 6/8